jgi:succinate-semialdehyde dehydrogenase/glutarate-semialdehyde dehydrogenase
MQGLSTNLINGEWVNAKSGKTIEVTNPATGEVIGSIPSLETEEVRGAIDAAWTAWPAWAATTASERGAMLAKLSSFMKRDIDRLGRLMTLEQGKPLSEAKGEIAYAASFLDWAAEEGKRLNGDIVPASSADKRLLVLRQPVGVTPSSHHGTSRRR